MFKLGLITAGSCAGHINRKGFKTLAYLAFDMKNIEIIISKDKIAISWNRDLKQ
jgi:hypothetical protein